MDTVDLKENERIDDLEYKGFKIIQNPNYFCFGVDAVLLSEFAKEIKEDVTVVDLGTGNGILGILLCAKTKLKKIFGIEIQKKICDMAKRSIKMNKIEDRFEIINADIKTVYNEFKNQKIDVIVTNPPYKKENSGVTNENEAKLIARHEVKCTLKDIIETSSKILKEKGSLYMIHKTERLVEIIETLKMYKLEPKTIRFIHSNIDKNSKLVLIKANKNEGSFLKVEPPLIIYDSNELYNKEILKIYNK